MTTKEQKRKWYLDNREKSIERSKKYRKDHPEWAKKADAKYNASNPTKTWRQRNPEKAKALAKKQSFSRKLRKYGLSLEQYQSMVESQKGRCAICGNVPPDGLVIDHNHITGKVRGLLCNSHNVAIGMLQENPDTARRLIDYLERTTTQLPALEDTIGNNSPSASISCYSDSNSIN